MVRLQNGSSAGKTSYAEVEDLLRGAEALVLAPQPLGVGREALVEPDVLPAADREAVAEPLVGELVHDDAVAVDAVARRSPSQ